MSMPGVAIRAMPADLERLPAPSPRPRPARTRHAYAGDVVAWLAWLAERGPARWRPGGCMWTCGPPPSSMTGAAASSVRRHLSALSSFCRYCAAHDLIGRVPAEGMARPVVDPDYTATVGLDRYQARALLAAAVQALRIAAVVRLLTTQCPARR